MMPPTIVRQRLLQSLVLGLSVSLPITHGGAEQPAAGQAAGQPAATLPEELRQFNGMLIGQLVERDVERGTFTVKVDYVARVWENSRARNPRSAVGKTLRIDGVTGKWLDQLLVVRPGETLEFEAQHRGGETLTFPGEWLKKVAPFKAEDHPVPPDGFRGFAGVVTGKVVRKNVESHEMIVRIDSIEQKFERSRAENANEAIGKSITLAGFWGKLSSPLEQLKAGDAIRAGVLHRVPKSDHFTVAEFIEQVAVASAGEPTKRETAPPVKPTPGQAMPDKPTGIPAGAPAGTPAGTPAGADAEAFPAGLRGFRGILRGQLVRRDLEKGELVFKADRATRTWPENRATDTQSCRGRELLVKRIAGKWLDVLVTLKPGDQIEVEAFHNGGQHLDFVSEWLKKVE